MDLASAKVIGAGLAAIGVGAAAIGVGFVFGSFLQGALRNPAAADGQQGRLFLGFAARRAARPDGVHRRDAHPLRILIEWRRAVRCARRDGNDMPQLTQLPEIFWSQLFWLAMVLRHSSTSSSGEGWCRRSSRPSTCATRRSPRTWSAASRPKADADETRGGVSRADGRKPGRGRKACAARPSRRAPRRPRRRCKAEADKIERSRSMQARSEDPRRGASCARRDRKRCGGADAGHGRAGSPASRSTKDEAAKAVKAEMQWLSRAHRPPAPRFRRTRPKRPPSA